MCLIKIFFAESETCFSLSVTVFELNKETGNALVFNS